MRCGDHPNVDVDGPVGADRHDLPLLKYAKQFRLQVARHIPYLIEKYRSVVCLFEQPLPAFSEGSGKRSACIAEELALDQAVGDRGTVYRNERLSLPG